MALSTAIVWEVRTAGADTSGGGFKAGASGTDYSQQDAVQFNGTDLVIDGAVNTKVTSATHNFVAADVGNVIQITAGVGFTTGFFEIVSVAANAATLDRSAGTLGSTGGTWAEGGALATVAKAVNSGGMAGQNVVHAKNGTYAGTVTLTPPAGTAGRYTVINGYNATRGDLDNTNFDFTNHPIIQVSNTAITAVTLSAAYIRLRNFVVNCTGATKMTNGVVCSTNYQTVENCKIDTFTSTGINNNGTTVLIRRCMVTGGTAAASGGFAGNSQRGLLADCRATANACPGFINTSGHSTFLRCISYLNTTSSGHGFSNTGTFGGIYQSCVAWNNAGSGFFFSNSGNSSDIGSIYNCVSGLNSLYGVNNANTSQNWPEWAADYNAIGTAAVVNTSGTYNQIPAGAHDVTLTVDPFTNAAGGDFTLNNTAGGGAALRGAGFPAYLDIGALQHQDSGGGGGVVKFAGDGGGFAG